MTLKERIINQYTPGEIFSLADLGIAPDKRASASVMMSNMVARKEIVRLKKGSYYIPQTSTIFGQLPPDEIQLLVYICKQYNGYTTGASVYNKLGLTDQVPNVTEIATTKRTSTRKTIGGITILFKKAHATLEGKEEQLLQILDAITDIKRIPARTIEESIHNLTNLVFALSKKQKSEITEYATEYPPRTRYILANIFKNINEDVQANILKKTINNTTKFNYGDSRDISRAK